MVLFIVRGGDNTSKVWYSSLNADGTLGSWQKTTSLPVEVYGHQCFTANGFVYCAGGGTSKIWYALLNANGSLSSWQETTSLPYAVYYHQCITANGFVYCLGGYAHNKRLEVWYASLNYDGSLGNWQETTSLPYAIDSHQCSTVNGFVYCSGGYANNGKSSQVWNTALKANGSLGEWQRTTSLSYAVERHQCFTTNGYIYCIGGYKNGYNTQDVLIQFNPFITIPTHPDGNKWYITNNCEFSLSNQLKTPYGLYYRAAA